MTEFRIKQGDAYAIPVALKLNGEAVRIGDIEQVEFMLGHHIRRTYPEDVTYVDGAFRFPLTQAETFSLGEGLTLPLDVRVKFQGGDVVGAVCAAEVTVADAMSEQEI